MAVRQYELVYILPPETTEQQATELHDQVASVVSRMNGQIEKNENWGRRKLAYEIGKFKEGVYVLDVINGDGGSSPVPAPFALWQPADACFYDFFESGSGKWTLSGEWGLATLPGGARVMSDSPNGPYQNAVAPDSRRVTAISDRSTDPAPSPW